MTVADFQDALVKEIKEILQERLYQKAYSEERVQMNVYAQSTPLEFKFEDETDEVEQELQHAPFIIVRISDSSTGNSQEADRAKVYFHICIYDDDFSRQGHRSVLEIYEVMKQRFMTEQVMGRYYRADDETGIQLALQDEDTYPFYFGGIAMEFELPALRKEDKYC